MKTVVAMNTVMNTTQELTTQREELEQAIERAFAAVGRACEARARADPQLDAEAARRADMRIGNLAMFYAMGLNSDGCTP